MLGSATSTATAVTCAASSMSSRATADAPGVDLSAPVAPARRQTAL